MRMATGIVLTVGAGAFAIGYVAIDAA